MTRCPPSTPGGLDVTTASVAITDGPSKLGPYTRREPTTRAGMPTAIDAAGTFSPTTAAAPTTARSPIVTPSRIFTAAPIQTPSPIVTPADTRGWASTATDGSDRAWSPPMTQ